MKTVDLIIPIYNEEEVIGLFHEKLSAAIKDLVFIFTIYYINDGSSDGSAQKLAQLANVDPRVQVVELSRNFGHQAALTAGLDIARGHYVISLDGDGQHPPEMIGELLKLAESGYDIVLTERIDTTATSAFKRWTSASFYRLINKIGSTHITPGAADFRLLSQQVVQSLRSMPEYHRFLRGMVAWVGFKSVILPYTPPPRMAGKSKYSLGKMLRLSMDAVFSFSLVPLYIGISLGILMLLLALLEMIYVLSFWVTGNISHLAPGWSSLMFIVLLVGGFLMISIGVIGVYIGYIFQEVKGRPVYLVRDPADEAEKGSAAD
jgi:glycosyltransferase involved in cell wall biosynthesis